jgi:hypothetical protein
MEADISIRRKTGHFYFALTRLRHSSVAFAFSVPRGSPHVPCPNGRFARLNDPEGNPIQLWEPERGLV